MKKLLSFMLSFILVFSVAVMPANAKSVEVTDGFLNAVREEYDDDSIEKDDIYIMYMEDFKDGSYLVKYSVGDCVYPDDMLEIGLENYILTTSRPAPVLYEFGRIYDLEYAFQNGLLADRHLEMMLTFDWFYMEETKVTKELKDAKDSYNDEDIMFVRFTLDGGEKQIDDYENWIDDVSGTIEKLKAHYEQLHQKLISEVLNGYEYWDEYHNNGISIVGVRKKDIEAISENEFVVLMDYISEVHLNYIYTCEPVLDEYRYNEVANCYDENGNLSYLLINAHSLSCAEASCAVRVGDVVLHSESIYHDFTYKYGLFDAKEGKIYDIFDVRKTPEKYYKLEENLVNYAGAYKVGDSDGDGEVTIMDATKIQLCLAGLDRLKYYDHSITHDGTEENRISDSDNDGSVTIMDATAIQLKLAKI